MTNGKQTEQLADLGFAFCHFPFIIFHLSFSIYHFPFIISHLSFFILNTPLTLPKPYSLPSTPFPRCPLPCFTFAECLGYHGRASSFMESCTAGVTYWHRRILRLER